MHSLEQLQAAGHGPALLPADRAVAHQPAVQLSQAQARALSFGQAVPAVGAAAGPLRLYDPEGHFLGLGMGAQDGAVRPLRLIAQGAGGAA
jgi:tRNA U55 pseudouridine synthase TruB